MKTPLEETANHSTLAAHVHAWGTKSWNVYGKLELSFHQLHEVYEYKHLSKLITTHFLNSCTNSKGSTL